ncbi:MAG: FAD-dependent oxidoreductase [Gammaproteobacteria bacterium]|nr:FAD-dependent oxidoreductase [Gammaproteobacteria bacterium]
MNGKSARPSNAEADRGLSRRGFIGHVAGAIGLAAAPNVLRAAANPRVIVIGAGFGGATVAKYLRHWSGGAVDVVLIDRSSRHISCVMSNLVLNQRLQMSDLALGFTDLVQRYGVTFIQDSVDEIDGPGIRVKLRGGGWLSADRIVAATGINFRNVPGWDKSAVPHAWIAGGQTRLLRDQIAAMPDNGRFVMTIPKSPYRCPPGPYERACTVADILGRRSGIIGGNAIGAPPKVIVLDENDHIQAEEATFRRAFEGMYRNIIEYYPNAKLQAVDSVHRVAQTSIGDFDGDVLNVIGPQQASWFLKTSGLVPTSQRWAPVDVLGYESTVSGCDAVHIIGDSQGSSQPKSGHMANSQAKVCADAILRRFAGQPLNTAERLANLTTNSACFSPITYDQASYLTAVYAYNPATRAMQATKVGEAERWSREQYRQMFTWADNLWADSFN